MLFKAEEWDHLEEEQIVEKLAGLDGLLSLDRNEPCWCGSGAKYKKCCEALDRRKVFEPALYERAQFEDREPPEEYQMSIEEEELSRYQEIQDKVDQTETLSEDELSILQQTAQKHPRSLFAKHLFVMALEQLGKQGEADAILSEAKELLPDDLFTLLLEAQITQMRGGKYLSVLNNKETLPELWPDRTTFAPFEVLTFHESIAEHYANAGDVRGVEAHAQFLELLFSDHKELLESVREIMQRAWMDRNAQIIGSKFEALATV
jgi:tetratricopeptide (TPR) repeat protein